jgi:hypothetical protein
MPPAWCDNKKTTSYNNRLPGRGDEDTKGDQTARAGDFCLRVTIQMDKFPEETSWSLTHVESFTLLFWQPFNAVPVENMAVSNEFHDLLAGTYQFDMADHEDNGTLALLAMIIYLR